MDFAGCCALHRVTSLSEWNKMNGMELIVNKCELLTRKKYDTFNNRINDIIIITTDDFNFESTNIEELLKYKFQLKRNWFQSVTPTAFYFPLTQIEHSQWYNIPLV